MGSTEKRVFRQRSYQTLFPFPRQHQRKPGPLRMEESEGRVGKMKAREAELMAALGSPLLSHCYRPDSPAVTGTNSQETLYFTK